MPERALGCSWHRRHALDAAGIGVFTGLRRR
jgi:hypothetical protein